MFKYFHNKKAQSTLEYAIIVIIIVGALLALQTYMKRGIQGKLKSSADDIGDQYSPDNTKVAKIVSTSSNTQETFGLAGQGISQTNMNSPEKTLTDETSQVINSSRENWGN